MEDTFHKVILQFSKPDAFNLDNGTQYISRDLKDALGLLILFSIKNRIKNPLSGSDAFDDLDRQ